MSEENKIFEINAKFAHLRPISKKMPLKLSNGATFERLDVPCKNCKCFLAQLQVRGTVRKAIANSYVIDGLAYCGLCNMLTPFNCHVVPDGDGFKIFAQDRHPFDDKGTVLTFERKT